MGADHRRQSDSGGLVVGIVYGSPLVVERSSSFTFEFSATDVWSSRDFQISSLSLKLNRALRSYIARLKLEELVGLLVFEGFLLRPLKNYFDARLIWSASACTISISMHGAAGVGFCG